jgi:hypothetical protein
MTGSIAGVKVTEKLEHSAWRKAQGKEDSKQWAGGSKSQTTDYGTTNNQGAKHIAHNDRLWNGIHIDIVLVPLLIRRAV